MANRQIDDDMGASVDRRLFKDRLLRKMKDAGLRAADVARMVGISRDAMSSYTTMRSLPSPETLDKLAKAFKCKPGDLLPKVGADASHTLLELREFPKPGYKLFICRLPLPVDVALSEFKRMAPYAQHGAVSNGEDVDD